ncbi:MAG: sulfite exporter TauE/SafE family protein [Lentisphaerae bacterium]|jgi:uncharacterized protein|nr:sulfite exporter TauE/SafE family protein [Lentisphaerota bacterium]MBT4818610.1 sulfite exporter TauE/SafE family protein [Lentisphaerota bacterium]MBT5605692.1 sulfite exporter TauE/SafE family protein [Lentisphaerota bacterium]MBT7060518.1 sulfite exporter TauE/SafE family protein [Lentisphaerota bacterium]MBT7844425.1 sulfite exporter TauE/SafE family protein [Lentisphaerota bacterium]
MLPDSYGMSQLFWLALCILMIGMHKGGFPVGGIALPLMILIWPNQASAARSSVSFMLPVLCVMDVVALGFYRRKIVWAAILPLIPGTLVGVAIGVTIFAGGDKALVSLSDQSLKLVIGCIGILFVGYRASRKWLMNRPREDSQPGIKRGTVFGAIAGLTSTLAHAGGPPIQMYLLPQRLDKLAFAGTTAAYFWGLNLLKVGPFCMMGRITADNLLLGVWMLPVMPLGVVLGYMAVRVVKQEHYTGLIYVVLLCTSMMLIVKAVH